MLDIISTDLFRVLIIIPVLFYASYTDILTRRVDDKVWAIPTFLALILLGIDAYFSSNPLSIGLAALYSLIIVGGGAYIIYKFRLFYGADYKAFLLIAILFPWHPEILSLPIQDFIAIYDMNDVLVAQNMQEMSDILIIYSAINLFGFTVFVNTTLFSITYFIQNIIYNIKNDSFEWKKPLKTTCAREVNVSELDNIHAQIIDDTKSENKIYRGFEFINNGLHGLSTDFFKDYEQWYCENKTVSQNINIQDIDKFYFSEFLEDNEDWESTNTEEDEKLIREILAKDTVVVTMGVPFIVPITLGVLSTLIFGNLIYLALSIV